MKEDHRRLLPLHHQSPPFSSVSDQSLTCTAQPQSSQCSLPCLPSASPPPGSISVPGAVTTMRGSKASRLATTDTSTRRARTPAVFHSRSSITDRPRRSNTTCRFLKTPDPVDCRRKSFTDEASTVAGKLRRKHAYVHLRQRGQNQPGLLCSAAKRKGLL